jgi:hypothetical protein
MGEACAVGPLLVGFPAVAETTFAFEARELAGRVRVAYSANSDPRRWGYHLLGLDFNIDVARGFPVIEARVEYPAEGYAAYFGWIQIVRYWIGGNDEPTVIMDVAPQLREARMPYFSFGIQPVLFDAPCSSGENVTWRAWSFLTFTPDCVMTSVVEPACGFRWGLRLTRRDPNAEHLAARRSSGMARRPRRAAEALPGLDVPRGRLGTVIDAEGHLNFFRILESD